MLEALFAAQTKLDFEATVHAGSPAGDVSGRARDQIRRFRDSLADIASSPPLLHKTSASEPSTASGPDREAAQGGDRS